MNMHMAGSQLHLSAAPTHSHGAHAQFKPAFSGIFALVRLVIFTTAELAVIFD